MTERPILFSGAMVRALLAGAKTQTRRVVKLRGAEVVDEREADLWPWSPQHDEWLTCPYGAPGDRLWVRETWAPAPPIAPLLRHVGASPRPEPKSLYRANPEQANLGVTWRPSIHMPRWASRITLEVTGVRVERLQDVSEEDARAEGAASRISPGGDLAGAFEALPGEVLPPIDYRAHFRDLWRSINGADSWKSNPWVWVVEFKRATP